MKLKTFFVINAIVSCSFGMMSLLIPAQVMRLYGVEPNPAISLLAQYSGLGSVALGLVPWFSRNMELTQAQRTVIPAMLICNVIGVIISLLSFVSGTLKLGLLTTGLYFIFSLVYVWFLFAKSQKN